MNEIFEDFLNTDNKQKLHSYSKKGAISYLWNFIWYLLPILTLISAKLPQIQNELANHSANNVEIIGSNVGIIKAYLLNKNLGAYFGTFSLLPILAILFAIWKIAKGLGAPIWARSFAACFFVITQVFGFLPNLSQRPDDAILAALILNSLAFLMMAFDGLRGYYLGISFLLSFGVSLLMPISIWPQIAVFLATVLVTSEFEDRPYLGLFSTLCAGPLFLFLKSYGAFKDAKWQLPAYNETIKDNGSHIFSEYAKIYFGDVTSFQNNALEFIGYLPSMLPLIILFILGIIGLIAAFFKGWFRRINAMAFLIFFVIISFAIIVSTNLAVTSIVICSLLLGASAAMGGGFNNNSKNNL